MSNLVDGDPTVQFEVSLLGSFEYYLLSMGVITIILANLKGEKQNFKSYVLYFGYPILILLKTMNII